MKEINNNGKVQFPPLSFPSEEANKAPDLAPYLLPSETIDSVKPVELQSPPRPLSSMREIHSLTQTGQGLEIGQNGPSQAAKAVNTAEVPKELMLYEAVFGRDSLRVALDLIGRYPQLTRATLVTLAESQGLEVNERREEEPGRIAHEVRDPESEIAKQLTEERGWGWPYYGSVDATPEFIRAFCAYSHNADRKELLFADTYVDKHGEQQSMLHAFDGTVDWVTGRLDANREGLLEYKAAFSGGTENQAWKDSWDAYFHSDGTIANHDRGIASVEVQRLAYDALLDAAGLYASRDRPEKVTELHERADKLREQIFEKFWTDEKSGYFVLGTDRDEHDNLRPLKIRTSNMGHLLHSRLLQGDGPEIVHMREAVVRHLFTHDMLNVSGVRTLAMDEKRFKPGAYHNGSVWIWDTYFIAKGLRYHDYHDLADNLEQRILNVANQTKLLPEFVRGDTSEQPTINDRIVDVWDSQYERINRIEQVPQEIQAWTAAAVLSIKSKIKYYSLQDKTTHKTFQEEILKGLQT